MILTQERSFMNTDRIYSKKSEFLFLRTPVRLVSDFCLALDGQHKRSVFINRQASQGIPFTQHFPNETFLTLRRPFLFLDVMLQSIFCIIHLPTFSISKKGFWKWTTPQRENVTFGDFDFGVVFWFDSKLTTWKLSSKFPLWMKLYHHQQISEQLSVIIMQMEFKLLVRTWNPRLNVSNCFIAKFTDSRWHLCRIPQKFALTLVVRFCICFPQAPVDGEAEVQLSALVTTTWLPFKLPHIKIICRIIPGIFLLLKPTIKRWEYDQEWVYVTTVC